jgi:biopolymer transport protein ExbD/biopolymer transport protein TolR
LRGLSAGRTENHMPQMSKSTQSSLSEINMVPFIDIVLVLLIIFMITAPILQSSIEVDVPKTKTIRQINEQKIVVTMDKNQLVYLGNDPINVHDLGPKVSAKMKKPNEGIFLRCDKTVPFGAFASLMDALRQAGISNISIVTEPLPEKAKG